MKKGHAIAVLALPLVAAIVLVYFTLASGFPAESLTGYFYEVLCFLVLVVMFEIPAYVIIPIGLTGFGVGAWLLLTSQSRRRPKITITFGILIAMLPALIVALTPLFARYRGP